MGHEARICAWGLVRLLLAVVVTSGCGSGKKPDADAGDDADAEDGLDADATDTGSDVAVDPDADVLTDPDVDTSGMSPTAFCNHQGWCWENPTPHGNTMYAVWINAGGDVWMAGDPGQILMYDGSEWWEWVSSENMESIRALWGTGPDEMFALATTRLLHYDGSAWSSIYDGSVLTDLWGFAADDLWVTAYGMVRHWNGTTWEQWDMPSANLSTVWGLAQDDVWVGGVFGVLRHYDGETWENLDQSTSLAVTGIWGNATDDVYFSVTGAAQVLHWNGSSVESIDPGYAMGWTSIWGTGPDDIWMTGQNGLVVHYDGEFFTNESPLPAFFNSYTAVHVVPGAGPWVVGPWGLTCDRTGGAWSCTDSLTYTSMIEVGPSASDTVTAMGGAGVVATRDASGWTLGTASGGHYMRDIWQTGVDDAWGYVTGYGYDPVTFYQWDGLDWTEVAVDAPQGIRDVWLDASGEGWAVGTDGVAYHFDGSQWTGYTTPTTNDLLGVHGLGPSDVWAVGVDGTAIHYDGHDWTLFDSDTTDDLAAVWGAASNDVWAVGRYGTAAHFTGSAWTSAWVSGASDLDDLHGFATDDVWAVGYAGHAFNWDGDSWNSTDTTVSDELFSVWGAATDDVWAVGDHGVIVHWNGSAWTEDTSVSSGYLHGVGGTGADDVWIVGWFGDMYHWAGSGWTLVESSLTETGLYLLHVFGQAPGELWVVDNDGGVHATDGTRWTRLAFSAADEPVVRDVWASGPNDAWAVTDQGMLLHYDGTSFRVHHGRGAGHLDALAGLAPDRVWAAGDVLLAYDGDRWQRMADLPATDDEVQVAGMHGTTAGVVLMLTVPGKLLRFDGSTVSELFSTTGYFAFQDAFFASDSEMWAVGQYGRMLYWNGASYILPRSLTFNSLTGIWGSPAGDLWAVGASGTILHRDPD